MVSEQQKSELSRKASEWLAKGAEYTQAELARRTGVSQANISIIVNRRWEGDGGATVGDAIWQKMAVFFAERAHIDSTNYLNIVNACRRAQEDALVFGIDGYTGAGKSYALERYAKDKPHVFIIRARRSMNVRTFMKHIGEVVGVTRPSGPVYDIEQQVIDRIVSLPGKALLIFDECEYLKPAALDSVKTLIQELRDRCGFVVCGIIRMWMKRMAERERQGMPQLLRRISHSWVIMEPVSAREVREFAAASGINDPAVVAALIRDSKEYDALTVKVRDILKVQARGTTVTEAVYKQLFN